MSLLSKLLKLAADKVADHVSDQFQSKSAHRAASRSAAPVPPGAPAADCYSYRGSVEDYFAGIISQCFPDLRVYRNEPLAGPGNVPVSFLLYRDGKPVLALILCSSQEYRRLWVANTVAACEARSIPVQRYYREFRNEAGYVVDRIRTAL